MIFECIQRRAHNIVGAMLVSRAISFIIIPSFSYSTQPSAKPGKSPTLSNVLSSSNFAECTTCIIVRSRFVQGVSYVPCNLLRFTRLTSLTTQKATLYFLICAPRSFSETWNQMIPTFPEQLSRNSSESPHFALNKYPSFIVIWWQIVPHMGTWRKWVVTKIWALPVR